MMLMLDAFVEQEIEGIFAAWPGVGTNTADSLIGQTRQIFRGNSESSASYETRLRQWLDIWILAGSPWGLLLELLGVFIPDQIAMGTVDDTGNYDEYAANANASPFLAPVHTQPADGPGWNWDGAGPPFGHLIPQWWRMWVVMYPDAGLWTQGPFWGDGGHWGDATRRWGIVGITDDQLEAMRAVTSIMKAAHTWVVFFIVSFNPSYFLPTSSGAQLPDGHFGRWGKVFTVAGVPTYVAARYSVAAYIDGVS